MLLYLEYKLNLFGMQQLLSVTIMGKVYIFVSRGTIIVSFYFFTNIPWTMVRRIAVCNGS